MSTVKEAPSGVRSREAGRSLVIQLWRWGLLAALILLWELGARLGWLDHFYFSSPSEIVHTALVKWQRGDLGRDILYTGASTLLGFVLGTVAGSVIGLLFWFSRRTALVAEPYLIVLNALPKLALAPVLVILFGIGFSSKVVLAFLMTVVTAAISAYGGVQGGRSGAGDAAVLPWGGAWACLLAYRGALRHAVDYFRTAGQHRPEHGGGDRRRIYCIRSRPLDV